MDIHVWFLLKKKKSPLYTCITFLRKMTHISARDEDHGFCITELNSNISGGDLCAYFNQWGNITMCDIKACPSSSENKIAFVMLSTKEEADRADWAGPHRIKGTECKVRRIVNLKIKEKSNDEAIPSLSSTLEDTQWFNKDADDQRKGG